MYWKSWSAFAATSRSLPRANYSLPAHSMSCARGFDWKMTANNGVPYRSRNISFTSLAAHAVRVKKKSCSGWGDAVLDDEEGWIRITKGTSFAFADRKYCGGARRYKAQR